MDSLKYVVRAVLGTLLRLAPPGTPEFIYRHLLRLPPLRAATNLLLKKILPERVVLEEGVLTLNPHDPVISGALALGVYEPYETRIFRSMLTPGMTVLDVGANIGFHTVIAAARVGATGAVIALEPEPESHAFLARNVRDNDFKNVTLCAVAAANTNGTLMLHVSDANKGKHSLVTDSKHSREFSKTVPVPVRRIDDLLTEIGGSPVDVVKMDIEGAEPLALEGMPVLLASPSLILFIEFSPVAIRRAGYDPSDMLETLAVNGFTLHEIHEETEQLVPVEISGFAARFKGDAYANLLCRKGDAVAVNV